MEHPRRDEGAAPEGRDWRAVVREAGPYLGLGVQLAGTMFAFVFGGYFLDGWLGTTPWLTIAGAVLGMIALFTYIFRLGAEIGGSQAKPKVTRHTEGYKRSEESAGKHREMSSDEEAENRRAG